MKSKFYQKILFSILLFGFLFLTFLITKPFLSALLTGSIIAYLLYPLYEKILNIVKRKSLASLITTIFVVLLFLIPSVIVLGLVSKEAYATYATLNQQNLGTNLLSIICRDENFLACKSADLLISLLPNDDLDYYLQAAIGKITKFVIDNASKFISYVPSLSLNFFVVVFVIYYLLKDGDPITKKIKDVIPLKDRHKHDVIEKFHMVTYAVFYGNISIAVFQGILGTIGFIILGVSSPILWGAVMMLFALIPYFGTAIIWLPAALNLIFVGYLQDDYSFTIRGVALIVYGIFVISTIDNLLKPKLIGDKANVHPVLVLLGVLGGLNLFGVIGFILGPLMLSLLMTFIDIYKEDRKI